jgi:hypothetical protein
MRFLGGKRRKKMQEQEQRQKQRQYSVASSFGLRSCLRQSGGAFSAQLFYGMRERMPFRSGWNLWLGWRQRLNL